MNPLSLPTKKKSGFVVLFGRSNVGKSTLLNALVGSKIAITTPKPQTTRKPIQGVVSDPEGQIVFVDTPGIFKQARDSLSKKLLEFVRQSLSGIDALVYVADPTRSIGPEERFALNLAETLSQPKILVINKTDLREREMPYLEDDRALADRFDEVFEISAKTGKNLNLLKAAIFERLPEGEPFYPEGQLTNMPNKEWLAELIREKLFLRLRQELPYNLHVVVDEMDHRENGMLYIQARILVTSDRYKKMVIGAGGRGIKEIGQSARRELEAVTSGPVYLDLMVETNPHWIDLVE
ncbi:MAG TPA: GTPase Era [Patescibacteria group bacterium]|nr:GTPase Era [Patescibacteria group bacterium]